MDKSALEKLNKTIEKMKAAKDAAPVPVPEPAKKKTTKKKKENKKQ